MPADHEQRITVRPDTLANLISFVARGDYRIPQFQREFVWNKTKIRALFDSIYQEYPIGSFFLWQADQEHNTLFRHTVGLGVPPVDKHDSVFFILDGQQRITSLYVTLTGLTVNGTDYSKLSFDLEQEKFIDRRGDNNRYIAVCDLWGPDAMVLSRQIDEKYVPVFSRCWRTLQTYPVSIVEVRDKDLSDVCKIFQRINQSGKRLDRFDLISAMTFTDDFDLRERFNAELIAPLVAKRFGKVSSTVATQVLALLKDGSCTERHEYGLTTDDIKRLWKPAVQAILLAADTLRKNMGVVNSGYLPYDALLTLTAYYFGKSEVRSPSAEHMDWLRKWFWRSSFGQRYGSGGATRLGQDRELLDKLIGGEAPKLDIPVNISVPDLVKVRMTQTGSARRNAFLCMLAIREPRHLANNSKLDLINGGISGFTDAEKHHIFPRAFLAREGPAGADTHSLPNFCFTPAELNKRILDAEPAKYFPELASENPQFVEAVKSHLLATGPGSGVPKNDYLKFLEIRGGLILEEIRRLCGEISTPREDERQAAVQELEQHLRDLIHTTLAGQFGENYWKSHVPPDVRTNAENRIKEALAKSADLKEEKFKPLRLRLDYLNVMDYLKIIENGTNWPAFETIFRKKQDCQRYMLSFGDYRNALMHNREMSELEEMNGRAALIWFANVLTDDDETEEDTTDE